MPATATQRSEAARKAAATRKRHAEEAEKAHGAETRKAVVERTTGLSDEVLKSLESGQRAAIDAVRKFVDTVDATIPALGERPSKRQEVVDAAMEMADRLVHTQYDFIRTVVKDAGKTLTSRMDGK